MIGPLLLDIYLPFGYTTRQKLQQQSGATCIALYSLAASDVNKSTLKRNVCVLHSDNASQETDTE